MVQDYKQLGTITKNLFFMKILLHINLEAFIFEVPQWHTFRNAQGRKAQQMEQPVHLAHQVSAVEPPPCCLPMPLWYYPLHIATSVNKTKQYVSP